MYVNFNFNKKIKYILYFILGFIIAISVSNAKAYEIELTTTGITIDEKEIYQVFTDLWSDFDINESPYILCYSSSGTYSCIAADERYYRMLSVGQSLYNQFYLINFSGGVSNFFQFNFTSTKKTFNKVIGSGFDVELPANNSNYEIFPINTPDKSSSRDTIYFVYSNFELSDFITGAEKLKGTHNVLDFSNSVEPYMRISFFDKNGKRLEHTYDCFDKSHSYCEIPFNYLSNVSYIDVMYYYSKYNQLINLEKDNYYLLNYNVKTDFNYLKYSQFSINFQPFGQLYIPKTYYRDEFANNIINYKIAFKYSDLDSDMVDMLNINLRFKLSSNYFLHKESIGIPYNINFSNVDETYYTDFINDSKDDKDNETLEKLDDLNSSIGDLNSNITSDNIDGASGVAGGFFNDFKDNDHGLSKIVRTPLTLVNQITSKTCQVINLPLPYVNKNVTLPCMSEVYEENFGSVFSIYQMVMFGFISYYVCINVFRIVKEMKDPNIDKIEVFDL